MAQTKSGTKKKATKSSAKSRSRKAKSTASARSDKSVQAYRDALDRSRDALEQAVPISRDRLQELFDDAVERGRMTRDDANELVSRIVSRGREASDDLLKDLEKLVEQARKEVETRVAPVRKRASTAAGKAARGARDRVDPALAEADRLRRRANLPGEPITAYDTLTANQVKSRLPAMTKADLRKVRTAEKNGKARKSVLADIEKRLK